MRGERRSPSNEMARYLANLKRAFESFPEKRMLAVPETIFAYGCDAAKSEALGSAFAYNGEKAGYVVGIFPVWDLFVPADGNVPNILDFFSDVGGKPCVLAITECEAALDDEKELLNEFLNDGTVQGKIVFPSGGVVVLESGLQKESPGEMGIYPKKLRLKARCEEILEGILASYSRYRERTSK